MNNQKLNNLLRDPRTNWKFILIVVILSSLVGGGILGYYYLWIADIGARISALELKITKDETANWKTYTNKTFSFSFKFPKEWGIVEERKGKVPREGVEDVLELAISTAGISVSEYRSGLVKIPRFELWVNSPGRHGVFPDIQYTISPREEDGERGVKVVERKKMSRPPAYASTGVTNIVAFGQLGGINYSFILSIPEDGKDYEPIFNKILSTFKFIE